MISGQPTVQTYTCTGSRNYCFPFRVIEAGDLLVLRIEADGEAAELPPSKYQLSFVGEDRGVMVTTEDAYLDGKILIWLKMQAVQPATYENNTPFPAQSHEDALDRLTLLNAMRREEFLRCIRVPFGQGEGAQMPPVSDRKNKLWACDNAGGLVFVPTIRGDDIVAIDAASLFFDHNNEVAPRLVIDPGGHGSTILPAVQGKGQAQRAVLMLQDSVSYKDTSLGKLFFSMNFQNWDQADAAVEDDAATKPRSRRSRFVMSIQSRSQLDAPKWSQRPIPHPPTGGFPGDKDWDEYSALIAAGGDYDDWNAGWTERYFPQEVGALSLTSWVAAGTKNAKCEALVVSAREEPDTVVDGELFQAQPSKCVAVQAITVRATQGPVADDRRQFDVDDDNDGAEGADNTQTGASGTVNGSFTLRLNGGTTNQPANYFRSWCASLSGGRAGYLNGHCLQKLHGFKNEDDPETDGDGIAGVGGVWGGRGFWHQQTFATYAKDTCPGWVTIGHDGIDPLDDDAVGVAIAPVDIKVNLSDSNVAWLGNVVAFNGARLLGRTATGWSAASGTPTRSTFDTETVTLVELARRVKALLDDLGMKDVDPAHRLIGH